MDSMKATMHLFPTTKSLCQWKPMIICIKKNKTRHEDELQQMQVNTLYLHMCKDI